jgi:predicted Zn-dependent peptidase
MNAMNDIITKENTRIKEKYHYYKDKSGLDVYVFPKKLSTTYAIFATKYGSIENTFKTKEDDEFFKVPNGVAHFLEHKMFENEDGSDTFEKFGQLGASANAYTSNEMTAYLFSCTDEFEKSLITLLDYVSHPYFTKENVEKEQGIIGQEIGMYDDNAGARLYYELLSLLYHNHNIKINICGTVHSIAQITPEVLYKCYNTFYNLSNMALVICGDVEVEDIQKITSKALKPQKAIDIVCQYPEEPKAIAKKSSVFKMHVANKIFSIGIKDVNFSEDKTEQKKRSFAVNIINELVFSSSSKFYNYLYNNGFIKQHLSAEYEYLKNCAHNIITGESDTPEQVFDLYKKEISKLKKNFPSEQDFDRIKLVMYSDYIRAFDSTEDIANTFVDCVFSGIDILDSIANLPN